MGPYAGKYQNKTPEQRRGLPFALVFLSFFLLELFGICYLVPKTGGVLWPLAFGLFWSAILGCVIFVFPRVIARWVYGFAYFGAAVYTGFQTGYYILFSEMMWLSDFRYAAEGADYADMLLSYPIFWWLGVLAMILLGIGMLWKFPVWKRTAGSYLLSAMLVIGAVLGICFLPKVIFQEDDQIKYAGSDYGRSQSAQAAYENMFNTHRLYQICGLYQTLAKDIYQHTIYPLTPSHAVQQAKSEEEIHAYFDSRPESKNNPMTGTLAGKNVVLVLMESMDDWMIGEHTPTIAKLMQEGINFTRFYTPVYGGIRTFNTEFAINTGSFLSSQGGYAFDYVTNSYNQSLANQLRSAGYSAKTFHYNDPNFYSRGEFTPAFGYEEYVCYADYLTESNEEQKQKLLYDDLLLFDNAGLNAEFFREGKPTLNFIITRSAHLSYKYNEVLSHWGLKKYPEYRGLTGNEETDCALLKAKLVDDLFARMMEALEAEGQLENTVLVAVTDHYTYGYKDTDNLLKLSGVQEKLLLEKTPCFIWSADLEPQTVDKVLNTADLLPTVLNLLGVESPYSYIGTDAFDETYEGFVPFSNGSWIYGDVAYDAGSKKYVSVSGKQQAVPASFQQQMHDRVQSFIRINNLILNTDYYKES